MSDDDDKQAEEEAAAQALADEKATEEAAAAEDYKAKFEAQQKVNKDLEAKLKKSAQGDGHARAKELEAELAKLQGREAEWQAAQEAQKVKDEALSAANTRILKAEIRAAAAGKLADPSDALRLLDLSEFEVGSDGDIDSDAVAAAIDNLIKTKPYLGVTQGDEKKFKGDADAGNRGTAGKPQMTEAEVKTLAAQGKHAEIEQARVDGRLNKLLGIT